MKTESHHHIDNSHGKWTLATIVVIGILFHVVYMYSIFDIYFQSPLEHGMQPYGPSSTTTTTSTTSSSSQQQQQEEEDRHQTSKRLVFIVGDGLRADKFFEVMADERQALAGKSQQGPWDAFSAPYMRSIIDSGNASWGISHTRAPTESRPGHVAMFAGFYEDMSAIFTGWKENIVEFDTVFNQSSYVLQIGSPDVVRMFHGDHIESHYYPAEMEDFAASNHTSVDKWVFDKLDELLDHSQGSTDDAQALRSKLSGDRVIIFLHLLGIDTSGHSNRPNSPGYIDSIRYVDHGVKHMQQRLDAYFGHDEKTTYIFTADHGMTTRGSHGDGDPECTRTPLLVWGNGIRRFDEGGHNIIEDGSMQADEELQYVKNRWRLDPNNRKDIHQADMAPLVASLVGINYPVHSVGRVPLSYIGGDERHRTQVIFINAKQIFEQFKVKQRAKRSKTSFFFQPYEALAQGNAYVQEIAQLIESESFSEAQRKCTQLIDLGLNGLQYYQTYDWTFLMTCVTLGYIGWMAYILVFALKRYTSLGQEFGKHKDNIASSAALRGLSGGNAASAIAFTGMTTYLQLQSAPLQYYVYVAFPIFFFNRIFKEIHVIVAFMRKYWTFNIVIYFACFMLALELFVVGYFRREIFSVCFIVIGIAPTVLDISIPRISWIISCIFMSFFTLLPADYGTDIGLVRIGGVILALSQVYHMVLHYKLYRPTQLALFFVQWSLLLVATWLVHSTEESLSQKNGLPALNQRLTWTISTLSLIFPLMSDTDFRIRLQSVVMSLGLPFIMLSVSYEVLFLVGFSVVLGLWLQMETRSREGSTSGLVHAQEFVTALFFIFFICVGFFGTGNLATIASFEISSVYRFITVFSPFAMTALLLFKLGVPLMLLTFTFTVLMKITKTPAFATFFIILALSDVMTLNFFFLISDVGSWLEIGNAISRFGIGNGMIILVLLLFSLAQIFVHDVRVPVSINNKKKEE